jgi:hypothetical protein
VLKHCCPAAAIPCPLQVTHRCPCTNQTVCGELQDKVTALAAAGKLPPFPVEGLGGRSVQPDKMGIETW